MALHQRGIAYVPAVLGIQISAAALSEYHISVFRYYNRAVFGGFTVGTYYQNHPHNANWFGCFVVAGDRHPALFF